MTAIGLSATEKTNRALLALLLILYPLGALPFILYEVYRGRKYAFLLLSLWMGLFTVLFPPVSDSYRHYLDYLACRTQTWNNVLQDSGMDMGLACLNMMCAKTGISFEMERFLITVASLQMIFRIFNDICRTNRVLDDSRYRLAFLLLLCLNYRYFTLIIGLRWLFAATIFTTGAYLLFAKDRKLGLLFAAAAIFMHFAITGFAVGAALLYLTRFRLSKTLTTALFLAGWAVSALVFDRLLALFVGEQEVSHHLNAYINGNYGQDVFDGFMNQNAFIYIYLTYLPLIPLSAYAFAVPWRNRHTLAGIAALGMLMLGVTVKFPIIQERFVNVETMLLLFLCMQTFSPDRFRRLCLKTALGLSALSFAATIYAHRRFLAASRLHQFIYKPAPLILANTYDEKWLQQNLDSEGLPMFQYRL